ncbi:Uncharacterised protein [uncultured archaeon]|nr:Uncharacterised protein [uncultured archaeon]
MAYQDILDKKSFEFIFSLTIVLWLLELSTDLPSSYQFLGWLLTLLIVIIFCVSTQILEIYEKEPDLSINKENAKGNMDVCILIGLALLGVFFILAYNTIENTNGHFLNFMTKLGVLSFAWLSSSTIGSFVYSLLMR